MKTEQKHVLHQLYYLQAKIETELKSYRDLYHIVIAFMYVNCEVM